MNRKSYSGEINSQLIEESTEFVLDFTKLQKVATAGEPVIPVVVQDIETKEILILAYVNETALRYTLKNKEAAFWSTSRNELWIKGKTSGDVLDVVDVLVNCEQNSLVYRVLIRGKGSCHTKNKEGKTRFGCYYRKVKNDKQLELRKDPPHVCL